MSDHEDDEPTLDDLEVIGTRMEGGIHRLLEEEDDDPTLPGIPDSSVDADAPTVDMCVEELALDDPSTQQPVSDGALLAPLKN